MNVRFQANSNSLIQIKENIDFNYLLE